MCGAMPRVDVPLQPPGPSPYLAVSLVVFSLRVHTYNEWVGTGSIYFDPRSVITEGGLSLYPADPSWNDL